MIPETNTEKKRILLVDDETSFTRLLKLNLEGTGDYEVREENRGGSAMRAAREFRPDVVLLDLIMPDTDGAEVAFQIKTDEQLKDTPIVFLTALVSKREIESKGGRIGGNPFLAKPVTVENVIACLEEQLAR